MKIATLTLLPGLLVSGAAWASGIPVVDPTTVNWPLATMITVLVLLGARYTYRAIVHRHYDRTPFTDPQMQKAAESMPPHYSTAKALAAFAAAIALLYFFA